MGRTFGKISAARDRHYNINIIRHLQSSSSLEVTQQLASKGTNISTQIHSGPGVSKSKIKNGHTQSTSECCHIERTKYAKMEQSMQLLLAKLDEKLDQQTKLITTSVTQNVMEALDDRIKTLMEENKNLKTKVSQLEHQIKAYEKDKRKNNLIFFGIEECGKTEIELVDYIKETVIETGTYLDSHEISNIYRIGQKASNNKHRPVVVTFTTSWKKHVLLKNKAKLPTGIYIKEDFSKDVLEKRKLLQSQVEEEKKKGNIAYLKYDKMIVIQPKDKNTAKRGRDDSEPKSPSPNSSKPKKVTIRKNPTYQTGKTTAKDIVRPGILNYVEPVRSSSPSGTSKNL